MTNIRLAQVKAGEDAVVERLQQKGLLPRTAIVINLDDLRDLMREFAKEVDPDNEQLLGWTLETFLQWVKKRQRKQNDDEINARR